MMLMDASSIKRLGTSIRRRRRIAAIRHAAKVRMFTTLVQTIQDVKPIHEEERRAIQRDYENNGLGGTSNNALKNSVGANPTTTITSRVIAALTKNLLR